MDNTAQILELLQDILERYCYKYEYSELEKSLEKIVDLLESEVQQ